MIRSSSPLRVLAAVLVPIVACCALVFGASGCHAPGPPEGLKRTPVEKPWTKETIEKNEYLWLELSSHRQGFMTGPVLAHDDKGDYLTTKDDATVHLRLADVVVMDSVEKPEFKFDRTPIEKPWTAETVEPHDHVWVETTTGKRQLIVSPTIASDAQGEYLTTKNDATLHLPLCDVTVLDAATLPQDDSPNAAGVAAQSLGGSFLAFWTVVLCFLPAIILVAVLA